MLVLVNLMLNIYYSLPIDSDLIFGLVPVKFDYWVPWYLLMKRTNVSRYQQRIGDRIYRYSDEQKMTELGRSSISEAFSNFCLSSSLPMTLAA